jgi:hypothetical protein
MSTTSKAETDKTALFGDSAVAATTPTAAPETTVTAATDTDLPEVDNSDAGSVFNEEEEEAPLPLSTDETTTIPETPNADAAPETPSTSVVKETPPPATPLSTSVINETPPPAPAAVDENSNEQVVPLADSEMAMLNGEADETTTSADQEVDGDLAKEEEEKEEEEEVIPYADLPFFLNEETTFNYGDMCPVCFHAMTKEEMDDNMLANLLPCGHTLHVVCCESLRKSMPAGNKTFNCPECTKAVAHAVTTTHTLGEQMEFKNQQGMVDSDEDEEEETDTEDEEEEAEMNKEVEEEPVTVPVAEVEEEIVSATPPKTKLRHTKKKKADKPHQRRDKLFSKKHKKHAKNK